MLLFTFVHTKKKTLKNNGTEPIKSDTVPVSFIVRAALGPEGPNTGHTCSTISCLACTLESKIVALSLVIKVRLSMHSSVSWK